MSAGAFVAASLANGIAPRELARAFIENEGPAEDVLHPGTLMHPAWGEFARRLARLPGLVAQAAWRYLVGGSTLLAASERLGRALPTGVFSNDRLEAEMRRLQGELVALQQWVEKGVAPDRIIAAKFVDNDSAKPVQMTRPLCVYPKAAKYKGTGDTNDAASFVCVDPAAAK